MRTLSLVFSLVYVVYAAPSANDIGTFWHVSDFHIDPTYRLDQSALSCGNTGDRRNFGRYGDYKCDAPEKLVRNSVRAMKSIKPDPDFLIWTGDDTPHIYNDTILNLAVVEEIIRNLTDILLESFPNATLYPALGNHDWSPKHQLPPRSDPFYDVIAEMWDKWLTSEEAKNKFKEGGFYELHITNQLRMMVVNSNLYYTNNKLTETLPDPAGQFVWMDEKLTQAAQAGAKVIMIGHVPPGHFEKHPDKNWYYPQHNMKFLEVLRKHSDVIGSMHFAHHHTDSFRLIKGDQGDVVSSLLLAPAVTPWATTLPGVLGGAANNPAIRLVHYSRTTGKIQDIEQYYMNLTKANQESGEPSWELLYKGSAYYNQPDMTTDSLNNIASKLLTDDELFDRYYQANGVLYDPNDQCTGVCRRVHYCAITEVSYQGYSDCMNPASSANNMHVPTLMMLVLSLLFQKLAF